MTLNIQQHPILIFNNTQFWAYKIKYTKLNIFSILCALLTAGMGELGLVFINWQQV